MFKVVFKFAQTFSNVWKYSGWEGGGGALQFIYIQWLHISVTLQDPGWQSPAYNSHLGRLEHNIIHHMV